MGVILSGITQSELSAYHFYQRSSGIMASCCPDPYTPPTCRKVHRLRQLPSDPKTRESADSACQAAQFQPGTSNSLPGVLVGLCIETQNKHPRQQAPKTSFFPGGSIRIRLQRSLLQPIAPT